MASLDLGTLIAHIKVEGAERAQSTFRGVSNTMGATTTSGTNATKGVSSFLDTIKNGIGNVNVFGTNLGTLAQSFTGGEAASIAMGTALGGVCTMGIMAAVDAIKALAKGCADFVKDSIKVGVSFQAQMKKVQAISSASSKDFGELTDAARDFGKTTIFSATEAAQAMEYTALAGWNAQETIKGLPGILDLAASSDIDLAKASDIVTDNLTAFNMRIEDSTHLADVMAYTMSHTNTNTLQLGEAYKSCAATCTAFGVSVEESTAWLGQLANAGIKGGEAGTALNAVLARMYGETKTTNDAMQEYGLSMYDANGNAKNFTQVMGELQDAMRGMSDEQANVFLKAVAGVNHLSDFATMVQATAQDVNDLTEELKNSDGAASQMTKTMTDNIAGLQKSIGSKIESIKLSIFTAVEPIITGVLTIVNSGLDKLSAILQPIGTVIGTIFGFIENKIKVGVAIFDSACSIVGALIGPVIDDLTDGFGEIGAKSEEGCQTAVEAIQKFTDEVVPACRVIGEVLTGVAYAITGNFKDAANHFKKASEVFEESSRSMTNSASKYNTAVNGMSNETRKTAKDISKTFDEMDKDTEKKVTKITATMKKVGGGVTFSQFATQGYSGQVTRSNSWGYANGTENVPQTGRYLVGEFGPEWVTLPKGASVTPNHSTTSVDMTATNERLDMMIGEVASLKNELSELAWKQKQYKVERR